MFYAWLNSIMSKKQYRVKLRLEPNSLSAPIQGRGCRWLGTQVVVFEFGNQTLVSGGHLNNDNALELTYKASDSLMVSVEDTDTSIGKYIESFNGIQGEGWIFFVDGSEAMVSAQYAEINSDSIVHWKII